MINDQESLILQPQEYHHIINKSIHTQKNENKNKNKQHQNKPQINQTPLQ